MLLDNIKSSLKNIFRNKKNIILILILSILIVLINIIFTFYINFNHYTEKVINKNIGFRTISANKDEEYDLMISKVKKIENVVEAYEGKYKMFSVQSDINFNSLEGGVNLLYGTSNTIPPIIKGDTLDEKSSGVAICPYYFYPDSGAWSLNIDKRKLLNPDELIGLDFEVNYSTYKIENNTPIKDKIQYKSFKIIGLYDNKEVMNPSDTCYISANDLREIRNNWMPFEESNTVNTIDIIVDSSENLEKVVELLEKMGFSEINISNELDITLVNRINILAILFSAITIIMTITIIINFIYKKIKNDSRFLGLLRACGYSKKNVIQKEIMESSLIVIISLIIGIIIFCLIFSILKYNVLYSITYLGYNLVISSFFITTICVFMLSINLILNYIFISRILNKNITDLIQEEVL